MQLPRIKLLNGYIARLLKAKKQASNVTIQPCNNGFSLIELLVVITIIALLIAVATISYTNAQQKARDAKRKTDLKGIQQALELHFQATGKYPPVGNTGGWCAIINNSSWPEVKNELGPYINPIPTDPVYKAVTGDYWYKKVSHTQYDLLAVIENSKDPDINVSSYSFGLCENSSGRYKYIVTNP